MPLNSVSITASAFARKDYIACILSEIMTKLVVVHAMKVYGRVALEIQSFLT
jgi:hypothetical protein